MHLNGLHVLMVEDLSCPVLEDREDFKPKTATDTKTPAGKAIGAAGGEGVVKKKSNISAPMISHMKKPEGHADHRTPSVDTLERLRVAGVNIRQIVPKIFK